MALNEFHNDQAVGSTGEDTHHPAIAEREEVNVFFDGTANNYYNVTAEKKLEGEESYQNALSNIARMWSSLVKDSTLLTLYVEGMGTTRNEKDSTRGLALATGETGIDKRVDSAFPRLVDLVVEKRGNGGLPAILSINVFGFSRGAAAARSFVHLVNTEKQKRFGTTWDKVKILCNFVGLFDTVASYGLNHSNDVQELHLNFEPNYATKVFHLIAGDEYRLNFPVSTIASAVSLKVQTAQGSEAMGYELRIPGAHSDVGGGYNDTETETRTLGPNVKDFVYEQGWYDASLQTSAILHTHQRRVQAEYHKVGLTLMVEQAHRYCTTQFPSMLLEPPSNPDILALHSTLREFARDEKNTDWNLTERLGAEKARAIRRHFFHQSFTNSIAMAPRLMDAQPSNSWPDSRQRATSQIPVREYFSG